MYNRAAARLSGAEKNIFYRKYYLSGGFLCFFQPELPAPEGESGGVTYSAPYVSLGRESWVSDSIFWGEQQSDAVFALFSLPADGERQRGYVTYVIDEVNDGYIIDAWINYTHQQTWMQYPVKTAIDHAKSGVFNGFDAFFTEQDALQFYPHDGEIEMIS